MLCTLEIKSLAAALTWLGNSRSTLAIHLYVCVWLCASNSGLPTRNSHASTPRLQMPTFAS